MRRRSHHRRPIGVESLESRTLLASGLGPSQAGGAMVRAFGDTGLRDLPAPADYDGDGTADLAVFRPATGQWLASLSTGGVLVRNFGDTGLRDLPIPADYDGDGIADPAVFRPATGQWLASLSAGGALVRSFGDTDLRDLPAPADYDGDGTADLAVFRPATGQWLASLSAGGAMVRAFGDTGLRDLPAPADYDGDGTADLAVFRPATGQWLASLSADGASVRNFGDTGLRDLPAPADYDGDGVADLAVFRPASAEWLAGLSWSGPRPVTHGDHVSLFIPEIQLQDMDRLLAALRSSGANIVATPIAWSLVEPEPGRFDFSVYEPALDRLAAEGYHLLFILDSSGRLFLDPGRMPVRLGGHTSAVPGWLAREHPEAIARDFLGTHPNSPSLDYSDASHLPYLHRFYDLAVSELTARYGGAVEAFAPGIMSEFEIKYNQEGYRWESFNEAAQRDFARFVEEQGGPADARMPVVAYNNTLDRWFPAEEPLFEELMDFRERQVVDYVRPLAEIVHAHGARTFGYFPQVHSFYDAIYAGGVIEELVGVLDGISVDYNYYDGYEREPNPIILPMFANYARNLGYDRVVVGMYVERFRDPATEVLDPAIFPVLRETMAHVEPDDAIAGIEVGNLRFDELGRILSQKILDPVRGPRIGGEVVADAPGAWRVGLLASTSNYYLWHGDWSNDRDVNKDALLASFELLSDDPRFDVEVLGEAAILRDPALLDGFDALILPHQTAIKDETLAAILAYRDRGGKLVQDARFGELDPDGRPKGGWEDGAFGIGGIGPDVGRRTLSYRGSSVTLPEQDDLYFTGVRLAAAPGASLLMTDLDGEGTGLLVRTEDTLAFGFLPQLVDDPAAGDFWRRLYLDEIDALIGDEPT